MQPLTLGDFLRERCVEFLRNYCNVTTDRQIANYSNLYQITFLFFI